MQLKISDYLVYDPKSLNICDFDAEAKINFFNELSLLLNNLVLISY